MTTKDYLDPERHSALLHQLDFISAQTNITKHNLHHLSAEDVCSEEEFAWVRNFKHHLKEGHAGMVIEGDGGSPALTKITSIGATMVRNSKDARIYSTGMLLTILDDRYADIPDPTVLLIPDLCSSGIALPKPQVSKLYNLLLERFIANKMTVAWVFSMAAVEVMYGKAFYDLLKQHFEVIEAVHSEA